MMWRRAEALHLSDPFTGHPSMTWNVALVGALLFCVLLLIDVLQLQLTVPGFLGRSVPEIEYLRDVAHLYLGGLGAIVWFPRVLRLPALAAGSLMYFYYVVVGGAVAFLLPGGEAPDVGGQVRDALRGVTLFTAAVTGFCCFVRLGWQSVLWWYLLPVFALAGVFVVATYSLPDIFHEQPSFTPGRHAGVWGDPNIAAHVCAVGLATCIVAFLHRVRWYFVALAALPLLTGLFLTFSRSGYLAFVITVAFAVFLPLSFHRRVCLCIGLVLVLAAFIVLPAADVFRLDSERQSRISFLRQVVGLDESVADLTNGRFWLWQMSFTLVVDSPVLGHGLGRHRVPGTPLLRNEYPVGPHNEFIRLTVESGIVTPFLYLLFLLILFRRASASGASVLAQTAGLLAVVIFVDSLAHDGLFRNRRTCLLLGIAAASSESS